MTHGPSVAVRAGAKINPLLVVHGRRSDGYHELSTLMLGLDLYDSVIVRAAGPGLERGGFRVTSTGPHATPDISTDATNLAARGAQVALQALGESEGPEAGLEIELEKQIPSRAGLGGGSSDAAGAALAVLELLRPGWHRADSRVLEAQVIRGLGAIGADCAFFFAARDHGAALSTGRGERVEPLTAAPAWHIALVTPSIECPTPAVYGALDRPLLAAGADVEAGERARARSAELLGSAGNSARGLLQNDLEVAALRAFPGLADWRALLLDLDLEHFALAGSGSSLFGVFEDEASAHSALDRIQESAARRRLGVRHVSVSRPAQSRLLHVDQGAPV